MKVNFLDFEIDKLTNSIENVISGEVFDTTITRLHPTDSKQIKKTEWVFNWHNELKDKSKQVYKLQPLITLKLFTGLHL